jgi:hypothetical protein
MKVFKFVRIVILLMILASVATTVLLQRDITHDWTGTIDIQIIPIIADQADSTRRYVEQLSLDYFTEIERYFVREATRYQRNIKHGLHLQLAGPITAVPPVTPPPSSSALQIAGWSLKLRIWAWQNEPANYHDSQVRLYILYQTPIQGESINHSTGLRNGLIGLIRARADARERSLHNVVISHELLHILGASDKYDLETGQPLFPFGYAEPDKTDRHPQQYAEIMGRSIALTANKHKVARRLNQTLIGDTTAGEIGWID